MTIEPTTLLLGSLTQVVAPERTLAERFEAKLAGWAMADAQDNGVELPVEVPIELPVEYPVEYYAKQWFMDLFREAMIMGNEETTGIVTVEPWI